MTIFIILTGENWNEIMVEVMQQTGGVALPAIFFMSLMIIGNYMLLNLFLAILLKFISDNAEGDSDLEDSAVAPVTNKTETPAIAADDGSKKTKAATEVNTSDLNDSIGLNSSNSNIEEEFEQIKMQL